MAVSHYLGIALAIFALFAWGFADFFIQKSSRVLGVWKVMFSVGVVGFIMLLPFVKDDIFSLQKGDIILLVVLGIVILFATLFNFLALKKGKMAIVEPLIGMELPITVALSISIGKDHLTLEQSVLIAIIFVGLLMVITMHHKHLHQTRRTIEKGVMLALVAAIGLAMTNFLVGVSSRQIHPLVVIWFAYTQVALISTFYLVYTKKFGAMLKDFKAHVGATLGQSLLYNLGWVAFALSVTAIATSIVTAISESYIILGVILGIFVNREKLKFNQLVGIVLAGGGIILLGLIT